MDLTVNSVQESTIQKTRTPKRIGRTFPGGTTREKPLRSHHFGGSTSEKIFVTIPTIASYCAFQSVRLNAALGMVLYIRRRLLAPWQIALAL
jgi:hypothetical protein